MLQSLLTDKYTYHCWLALQVYTDYAAAARNRRDVQLMAKVLMISRLVAVPAGLVIGLYTLIYTAGN